jgi:hypothetical protein
MTDPRSELAEWAKPPSVRTKHSWKLLERYPHTVKHRCKACGLTRVTVSDADRFPLIKYRDAKGIESRGRAPACQT